MQEIAAWRGSCPVAHGPILIFAKDVWDGIRMGVHNHSVWRKFLDAVLEPRTLADENGIIEYLRCYRHDLPPAVWIENRPLRPHGNGR